MKITVLNNNTAIMNEIGVRIKRNRLDMKLSQKELAKRAGLSVRTLSTIENGGEISLDSLIRLLRVMGYIENLNLLLPELYVNPEDYRQLGRERQRAPKKKEQSVVKDGWKWGDEK